MHRPYPVPLKRPKPFFCRFPVDLLAELSTATDKTPLPVPSANTTGLLHLSTNKSPATVPKPTIRERHVQRQSVETADLNRRVCASVFRPLLVTPSAPKPSASTGEPTRQERVLALVQSLGQGLSAILHRVPVRLEKAAAAVVQQQQGTAVALGLRSASLYQIQILSVQEQSSALPWAQLRAWLPLPPPSTSAPREQSRTLENFYQVLVQKHSLLRPRQKQFAC